MSFQFSIPGYGQPLTIEPGQSIFVLGANGTGKSSLLQRVMSQVGTNAKRISAGRQMWFNSSAVEYSPKQKRELENNLRGWDQAPQSRWMEQNPQVRSGIALFELVEAENREARHVRSELRAGKTQSAEAMAMRSAPIERISELLAASNIPIQISIDADDQVMASKNGSPLYGVNELSDGERNALLIGADVLTAKPNSLLIIDEPERHLHRSIISPLLSQLFRERSDCAFIIATHDVMLPLDSPDARVMLVRSCSYQNRQPISWEVDILPASAELGEELKRDIIGARRRVVFTEGDEAGSLDLPIYNLLFPSASVRPKGSSRDVIEAVRGVRSASPLHWLEAWGIVDNDGREPSEVSALAAEGVFALPFYSVESVYYHPDVVGRLARVVSEVTGADAGALLDRAIQSAVLAVRPHLERLAARAVEKKVRSEVFAGLPTIREIEGRVPVAISVDTARFVDQELSSLVAAADRSDWLYILTRCPVRRTPALDAIAKSLDFPDRYKYEASVLQLLRRDADALQAVRSLFGGLATTLGL